MVTTMHYSLVVFVVCCLALTTGDICTRPSTKPTIPQGLTPKIDIPTFSVDVEIYQKDLATIIAMKLYYDKISQMIHLSYLENLNKFDRYYYYKDDEILSFNPPLGQSSGGFCNVDTSLHSSPLAFMVGGAIKGSGNTYTISQPLDVFHFTGKDANGQEIYPNYVQKTKLRGKDVYEFSSCQTWSSTDGDTGTFQAQVTHYFTNYKDTSNWNYPNDELNMPVSMHVVGQGPGNSVIDITWNFFNLRPKVPPNSLETPPGIVCPNRHVDKPFPALPSYFKITLEVVDHQSGFYQIFNEIYDQVGQYAVIRGPKTKSSLRDLERVVSIDYFPSGLSFQIDEVTKHCTIKNITSQNLPFFTNHKGIAEFFSPRQFFMATGTDYAYLGRKMIRGIVCDTWTGNTFNKLMGNVTAEWYFALEGLQTWNGNSQEKDNRIPVKIRVWTHDNDPLSNFGQTQPFVDFNIFHVDYTKILMNSISIKPCLTSSSSNLFRIRFPNVTQRAIFPNQQEMEWNILEAIRNAAQVSFLRVSDFRMRFNNTDLVASFELLDAPPYAGDVKNPRSEPSLKTATANLVKGITSGSVKITLTSINSTSQVTFTASTKLSVRPSWDSPGTGGKGGRPGGPGGKPGGGIPNRGGKPGGGMPNKGGKPGGGIPNRGGKPGGGMPNKGGKPGGGMPNKGGKPAGGFSNNGGPRGGRPNARAPFHGNNKDSGYSGGAMAALGIVMLAVGLASGSGSSYYLIYKKGLFA